MSDPTPTTAGSEAQADAPVEAVGASERQSGAFDRKSYAAATNRGYGSAMSRGLELALTLLVMVGIGWFIDRQAGTAPLFTIVFSVLGFAGITAKLWIGYDLEMRKHEEGAVWNRGGEATS